MQVPAPMIWMFQQLVDSALAMDPQAQMYLDPLDQKVVEIRVTGFGLSVFLLVVDRSIQILANHDGDVDASVQGSPTALLALSRSTKGLFSGEVKLEGDLEVARAVRTLLASLDIDWEEQLSKVSGDTIAHQLGRFHRRFFTTLSGTVTDLRRDSSDYLTEETAILTNPQYMSSFLDAVDDLRDDTERLDARVRVLEGNLGPVKE